MKVESKNLKQALLKIKEVCSPVDTIKLRGKKGKLFLEASRTPYSISAILKQKENIEDFTCVLPFDILFSVVKASGYFEFSIKDNLFYKQGNTSGNIPLLPDYGFNLDVLDTSEVDCNFLFETIEYYTLKDMKFDGGESNIYVEPTGNTAKVYSYNYQSGCVAEFKSNLKKELTFSIDTLKKLAKLTSKQPYNLGISDNVIFAKVENQNVDFFFNASLKAENKSYADTVTATLNAQKSQIEFMFYINSEEILNFLNDCKPLVGSNNASVELTKSEGKTSMRISTAKGNSVVRLKPKIKKDKKNVEVQLDYAFFHYLMKKVKGKAKLSVSSKALIIEYKKPKVTYMLSLL